MEMEIIRGAQNVGDAAVRTYGLLVLYSLPLLALLIVPPHPAMLLVVLIVGVLIGVDVRGRFRRLRTAQNDLEEAVWKAGHTITASALARYAISDLAPHDGWELSTVLAMIGDLGAGVPLATVRLNDGREVVASVFHSVEHGQTYLVSADAGDNDLLDLVRKGQ